MPANGPPLPRLGLRAPLSIAAIAIIALAGCIASSFMTAVDRGISMVGTIAPFETATTIAHGAGGTIARVVAREGNVVAEGDVIVSLDRTELDTQIATLVARVAEARSRIVATRAEARALLERIDDGAGTPDRHVADLDTRAQSLQRDVASLEARIALAEQQLAQTEVRAPRAGRLVALAPVAPGDVVAPGAVLAEIAPPDVPVVIEARASTALVGQIVPGMPARAWLGGIFRREVAAVEARIVEVGADPVTDRRIGLAFHPVRVELARTREQLAERGAVTAGQRVELVVPTGVRSRLTQVLDPVRRNIDPAVRRWLKELLAS